MITERLIESLINGSNCDDGLSQRQADQVLDAEHWDQAIKIPELCQRNARKLSDPRVEPPSDGAQQIEVKHTFYSESRLPHTLRDAMSCVSPVVSQRAIE